MSELYTENLIDFSADDENVTINSSTVNTVEKIAETQATFAFNLTSESGRVDNNPFDRALQLANMLDDPFESVTQEAEKFSNSHGKDVETGCLISLSDIDCNNSRNNSLDESNINNTLSVPKFSRMGSTNSNRFSSISSINSLQSPSDLNDVFTFESQATSSLTIDNELTSNRAFITEHTILSKTSNSIDKAIESSNSLEKRVESSTCESVFNKAFVTDNTILQKSSDNSSHGECIKSPNSLQQPEPEESENNSSLKIVSTIQNGCDLKFNNNCKNDHLENKSGRRRDSQSLLKLSLANMTMSPIPGTRNSDSFEKTLFSDASQLADKLSKLVTESSREDSCDDLMDIKPNWLDSETDIDSDLEMLKIPILEKINKDTEDAELRKVNEGLKTLEKANVSSLYGSEINSKECNKIQSRRSLDLKTLKERVELERQKTADNASDVNGLIDSLKKIVFECSNEDKKAEANTLLESLSKILDKRNEKEEKRAPPRIIVRQDTFDLDETNGNTESRNQDDPKSPNVMSPAVSMTHLSPLSSSPSIQATMPDIVEQIGKLLGNDNINVVQTSLGASLDCNNPTYIVVMGTPAPLARQATQIYNAEGDGSPEFSNTNMRKRSQSWSLRDRSQQERDRIGTSPLNCCKTPAKLTRRKSFSTTPITSNSKNIRRSIYGSNNKNVDGTPLRHNLQNSAKRPLLETHREVNTPPAEKDAKQELAPRKLKLKSSELAPKPRGPLKALIPAKNMAPMEVSSSVSSPIDVQRKPKAITSTPVIGNTGKGVPNACSTPANQLNVSPTKNMSKNRTRYSFSSVTPKPKLNPPSAPLSRRRSLTEIKSPKKRLESVKELAIGKTHIKTIKLPQGFVKKVSKISPVKLTKLVKRESLLEKNKENKLPRAPK